MLGKQMRTGIPMSPPTSHPVESPNSETPAMLIEDYGVVRECCFPKSHPVPTGKHEQQVLLPSLQ